MIQADRPAIVEIGRVFELPDGTTMICDWTARTDIEFTERWTVEELREVAEQLAVLDLLPTYGEDDPRGDG